MTLPIARLIQGSLKEAVDYLADRAAHSRTGARTVMEKAAIGASDVLSSLGESVQSNPVLGKALLGGGLGAAVGAGHHFFAPEEPGKKKSSLLGKTMLGGMGGMALGGGLGAAQQFWPGGGSGEGVGSGGGTGGSKGVGVFEHGGKRFKIDPSLVKEKPELLSKVHELSSGPLYETIPGKVYNFFANNPFAPTTTPYVLPAMGADAALHSQTLRLGDRNWAKPVGSALQGLGWLGNKAKMPGVGSALNTVGERVNQFGARMRDKGLFPGMIDPKNSRNPAHLAAGIDSSLANDLAIGQGAKETLKELRKGSKINTVDAQGLPTGQVDSAKALKDLAENPKGELRSTRDVTEMKERLVPKDVTKTITEAGQPQRIETTKQYHKVNRPVTKAVTEHLTPEIRGEHAAHGAAVHASRNATNPALKNSLPDSEASVFRGPTGDRVLQGHHLKGSRLVKRLGAYLGIPAAEWALRSYSRDIGKSMDLKELMEEARRKGHLREIKGQ